MTPRKKAPAVPEEVEPEGMNLAAYRICPCCGAESGRKEPPGGKARRRYLADELRAALRRAEDGANFGPWIGADVPAYFENLLRENLRHLETLSAYLGPREYEWRDGRIVRAEGAGPRHEGNKRRRLSEDVERELKGLSAKDGLAWDTRPNDKALRARIRRCLAWAYDPADLTDANLRDLVGNAQRRGDSAAKLRRRRKPPK
jgi:hypothetical protein